MQPIPAPLVVEPTQSPLPDNIPCLQGTWFTAMQETYPGQFLDLTKAEEAMLHGIAKRGCHGGLGFDRTVDMFDYTIRNWSVFTRRAERDQGAYNLPDEPRIEFLVKYVRTAVNTWMSHNNLKLTKNGICSEASPEEALNAKVAAYLKEASLPASMQLPAQKPVDAKPTPKRFIDIPYEVAGGLVDVPWRVGKNGTGI